jgi:uncharacterized YigZ family protein
MDEIKDSYLTISAPAECAMRERSSKFLSYAYPVKSEEQIKEILDTLHKQYYDATHHCYAWRLGPNGEHFRANDDGEPSGTAGKPILGQLVSKEITDCLVVVVRYFGGTKLGVSGLIQAYREAAADVLDQADIIELTVDTVVRVDFSYMVMNDVMRIIKDESPKVVEQSFDNLCTITLAIRKSKTEQLLGKLSKVSGATLEVLENEL